jgi:large subunit ribosomal protein L40e
MQLLVRVPGGKHLAVDVTENSSVADLKSTIMEIEGITPESQRLIFSGNELNDEECFSMEDGSLIDLELRLLGGVGPSDIADHLKELANKYRVYKMICRKCYARLPPNAHNCRKRKCGHCANIRPKKKIKEKEKGK